LCVCVCVCVCVLCVTCMCVVSIQEDQSRPVLGVICRTYCTEDVLQHTATYCNTLPHCNTLHAFLEWYVEHSIHQTHCNTLQYTATHCNTMHAFLAGYVRIVYVRHLNVWHMRMNEFTQTNLSWRIHTRDVTHSYGDMMQASVSH